MASTTIDPPRNARDIEAGKAPLRFLVSGFGGSGKTTLFGTLPGRKFLYAFDPNALASIEGMDIDYEVFNAELTDLDISIKTLKADKHDSTTRRVEPKTYRDWEAHFEAAHASGFFNQYDWVGFDSFTVFQYIVMDRIMYLNGRLGKQPEQADYAAQVNAITNIFRVLSSLPGGTYCVGHTQVRQADLTKKISNELVMTGQLKTRIPLLFNNVLIALADVDDKGPFYQLQTVPDRDNPVVRTSLRGLAPFEDVTIPLDGFTNPTAYGLGAILKRCGR